MQNRFHPLRGNPGRFSLVRRFAREGNRRNNSDSRLCGQD
nr:MAG TPA: hypothetical protein [Caudoviricetes sp.]